MEAEAEKLKVLQSEVEMQMGEGLFLPVWPRPVQVRGRVLGLVQGDPVPGEE